MDSEAQSKMVTIRFRPEITRRLDALSRRTGRTKTYYVREAVLRFLEDMEDTYIALERLENPGQRVSMKEAEKLLGVDP